MSDISGPGGNFVSQNCSAHWSGWAAQLNITNVENTGFAENGVRTYLPTALVVTGSAVGTAQVAGPSIPAAGSGASPTFSAFQGTFTLTNASGNTMSFFGNLLVIGINRPNDGKSDISISFTSSGPLTGTW